ncbi:MAG: hypothetical protein Q9216_007007 [Gyalolechia sp. 2 TL-2023]
MLQLHVWGPAFGLPSLDPQCLAAIAYLTQAIPHAEWELIASSNPALSPTRELPALRHGSMWIGGLQNILHHLHHTSGGQWDLDRDCHRADIAAYTSFLQSNGQPLLDLSLYVSSENYHASTRPAYSHILQWPDTWLLPPKRRAAAKARTAYLNFSALDLDGSGEHDTMKSQFAAGTEIPRIITSTQQSVSSLLKLPQHATRFRLDTLAESFFGPLSQLQQGKKYLTSEGRMTSLDCLALGYLSLALLPEVPQPWLSQSMKSRYPSLCHYVEDLAEKCFGSRRSQKAGRGLGENSIPRLPWRDSSAETMSMMIRIRSSLESLPYVGALYQPTPIQESTAKTHEELSRVPVVPTAFVGFAASVTALVSFYLFTGEIPSAFGVLPWLFNTHRRSHRLLSDMGDAGVMLGAVNFRRSSS